jgi:hypothetical protein
MAPKCGSIHPRHRCETYEQLKGKKFKQAEMDFLLYAPSIPSHALYHAPDARGRKYYKSLAPKPNIFSIHRIYYSSATPPSSITTFPT